MLTSTATLTVKAQSAAEKDITIHLRAGLNGTPALAFYEELV